MRHGRAARNRFDWFVTLVRLVFPDTQAETLARLARQTAECGPDGLRDARDLLHSALVRAESEEVRLQLLHATFRESWDTETLTSLSNWLDLTEAKEHMPEVEVVVFFSQMPLDLRKKLGYKPADARWWFILARALEEKESWLLAEMAYRKSMGLDPGYAGSWGFLANLLARHLSRTIEAETLLRKAIDISPQDPFYHTMLGNILNKLDRYDEAEAAFKSAIEQDSNYQFAWALLGSLLTYNSNRNQEAEQVLLRAIQIDPTDSYTHSCIAGLLAANPERISEARSHIRKALELKPDAEWYQIQFTRLAGDTASDWQIALPGLAAWCAANPKNAQVFDFTVNGFLQYARLTSPADAMAILATLPNSTPFETIMDVFRAHAEREHLNRLAPERRALTIELLNRLSTKESLSDKTH
jgi:tetratricopeptide (TPR) repeat protein